MRSALAVLILAAFVVGCGPQSAPVVETDKPEPTGGQSSPEPDLTALVGQPDTIRAGDDVFAKTQESGLAGKWSGRLKVGANDATQMKPEEVKAAEATPITLEVKADGTYTMTAFGQDGHGTWTMKGGDLVHKDSESKGTSEGDYREQVINVEDGGKKLVARDPGGKSDSAMVFSRA